MKACEWMLQWSYLLIEEGKEQGRQIFAIRENNELFSVRSAPSLRLHLVVVTFPIRQVALHMHDTTQPRANRQMIVGWISRANCNCRQSASESQMYLGMIIIIIIRE